MKNEMPKFDRSLQVMEEAEQTLRAIQYGTVDAFVVEEPEGHRVYTLEGSDLPYSTLVERMQQGAAMLEPADASFTAISVWRNCWVCPARRLLADTCRTFLTLWISRHAKSCNMRLRPGRAMAK
jgi:hypothetical protein